MAYKTYGAKRKYRRKFNGQKKYGARKWKVGVDVGARLPGIGHGRIRFGNYALNKRIKTVVSRMGETKQFPVEWTYPTPMERVWYTFNPWQFIKNGTGGSERTGKEIFLRHFSGKMNIATNVPLKMRMLAMWIPGKFKHPTNANVPYPAVTSNLWGVGGTSTTVDYIGLMRLIDNKLDVKVVYDRIFYVNLPDDGLVGSKIIKFDFPVMQKIKYEYEYTAGDPPLFNDDNLYIVYILEKSQNQIGSLTSTSLTGCRIDGTGLLTFKDQD